MSSKRAAPPRSGFVRGSILGAAVMKASAKRIELAFAQPFRGEEHRARATRAADEDMARILFDACGILRGTALKLAQLLAMEPELVPEAYRAEFAKASHRAPPINRALALRIVQQELGAPASVFSQFETRPFAAASLGQVHAATHHSGAALAVKIQYPGIADGVNSDLAMLRAVLRPTRYARIIEHCFDELRARLNEELDYRREAEHTAWFGAHLEPTGVIVPRVYPELGTRHVLTTERLAGVHLEEWLARRPSQRARNAYGQLLADLFHRSVFELGCVHADPNLGNYLFREDGRLGLLDFGCVRRIDPELAAAFRRLVETNDLRPETTERVHASLGVHYRRDIAAAELSAFLRDWGTWISEPYRRSTFDFAQHQDYFARGAAMRQVAERFVDHHEGAFVFFGRAHHGLLRLLGRLGARVRMRPS